MTTTVDKSPRCGECLLIYMRKSDKFDNCSGSQTTLSGYIFSRASPHFLAGKGIHLGMDVENPMTAAGTGWKGESPRSAAQ